MSDEYRTAYSANLVNRRLSSGHMAQVITLLIDHDDSPWMLVCSTQWRSSTMNRWVVACEILIVVWEILIENNINSKRLATQDEMLPVFGTPVAGFLLFANAAAQGITPSYEAGTEFVECCDTWLCTWWHGHELERAQCKNLEAIHWMQVVRHSDPRQLLEVWQGGSRGVRFDFYNTSVCARLFLSWVYSPSFIHGHVMLRGRRRERGGLDVLFHLFWGWSIPIWVFLKLFPLATPQETAPQTYQSSGMGLVETIGSKMSSRVP